MKTFKFAIVDMNKGLEILKTFNSLEEIKLYYDDHEADDEHDIMKVIDVNEQFHPGNFILYTEYFWRWHHLSEELEDGDITEEEFLNSYNEIVHEEKVYLIGLSKTKE